jgi:uncharacterized phage protein gp47/JayE
MISPAITPQGFYRPERLADILELLKARLRGIFGNDINLDPDTQDGQMVAVFAEAIDDVVQLVEDAYNARNPNAATGNSLYSTCLLNGVKKAPGSYATVALNVTTIAGAIIPQWTLVSDTVTGVEYQITTEITGTGGVVACTGLATKKGTAQSQIGNVTKVVNPTYGLVGVTNPSLSAAAAPEETDEQLRIRRTTSAALPSQGLTDGVRAALLALSNHPKVKVWENQANATANAKGTDAALPAHSLTCIVSTGSGTDIARAIYLKKSQGVTTVGALFQVVSDSYGNPQTVHYSLATPVRTVVNITYVEIPGQGFGAQAGENAVAAALAAWVAANQEIGADVVWAHVFSPANAAVPGINGLPAFDIKSLKLGRYGGTTPAQADLSIAYNELATLDASDVSVTVAT